MVPPIRQKPMPSKGLPAPSPRVPNVVPLQQPNTTKLPVPYPSEPMIYPYNELPIPVTAAKGCSYLPKTLAINIPMPKCHAEKSFSKFFPNIVPHKQHETKLNYACTLDTNSIKSRYSNATSIWSMLCLMRQHRKT
eukprot:408096-Ditylum_brightwellii.AAC.1